MSTVSGEAIHTVKQFFLDSLERAFSESDDSTVLVSILGGFAQNKIDNLLKTIPPLLSEHGAKRRVTKRIGGIMIEALQNISKHGTSIDKNQADSFLIISKSKGHFTLTTGNTLLFSDANSLKKRIDDLNNLSSDQLKKVYIETLFNDDFSLKGGARLELISIAKKSKYPLMNACFDINEKVSYFVQSVRIDNKD